jgi:hypothetical protein
VRRHVSTERVQTKQSVMSFLEAGSSRRQKMYPKYTEVFLKQKDEIIYADGEY